MSHFTPFHAHMALGLQLIALVSGVLLLNKASTTEFFCKKTGKTIGGFVVILSILSILCLGYLTINRLCCHRGEPGKTMMWQHPQVEMPHEESR